MQPFGRNRYKPKIGGYAPLGRGARSLSNNVVRAEAYLHGKFHRGPSNRLATLHERHRQDRVGQTTVL